MASRRRQHLRLQRPLETGDVNLLDKRFDRHAQATRAKHGRKRARPAQRAVIRIKRDVLENGDGRSRRWHGGAACKQQHDCQQTAVAHVSNGREDVRDANKLQHQQNDENHSDDLYRTGTRGQVIQPGVQLHELRVTERRETCLNLLR